MHFTVHHIPVPHTPPSISALVCVSPGVSWVTDVCYPTPSELARCDSQCQRGGSYRPACFCRGLLWKEWDVGGAASGMCWATKAFTWHSLAEDQTVQWHDLWEEISAAAGVLALIGCLASRTPRQEMTECARQKHGASASICMSVFSAVCLPSWRASEDRAKVLCLVFTVLKWLPGL